MDEYEFISNIIALDVEDDPACDAPLDMEHPGCATQHACDVQHLFALFFHVHR
ncbi:hypothetical protein GLOTRDRAFT_128824 [Gloeophyllum trabeum ATCC 11539]|uniref:Uncharacterized protein n=1 Tax=Gloeophyllum trabeum (strain ATCC 11539 / FP-39264 / Madison 617) TaxID=670483 RepID=S7Q6B1_GLOTA|nr:uncharacterized protein GLOTRDRAFT_128824 [Gloeophyllum trabeum ATCC 11539]EPQ55601.1 hypothetical protein GLOTRDRAFT_128824 [Gloeophyllum trabeum ATCC 11539]